ncbi:MAG TPA: SRPBCC family protein [Burkholderiales bacterium]
MELSVSINAEPSRVYEFASNPLNIPKWAAGLAGAVKVEFVEPNHLGILDHRVTLPSGRSVMVPLRVNAKGSGSEVVFTLIQERGMTDKQFAEDAKLVMKDLAALKKAVEE